MKNVTILVVTSILWLFVPSNNSISQSIADRPFLTPVVIVKPSDSLQKEIDKRDEATADKIGVLQMQNAELKALNRERLSDIQALRKEKDRLQVLLRKEQAKKKHLFPSMAKTSDRPTPDSIAIDSICVDVLADTLPQKNTWIGKFLKSIFTKNRK